MKRQTCPICNRHRFVKFLQNDGTCKLTGFLVKKNCAGKIITSAIQTKLYFFQSPLKTNNQ